MTDGRPDNDSGDDEQSEESSDAEVTCGDADDTKNAVAYDTQMRYSLSFLPVSTQVCVETDVNRPKEKGQPVMEGTQLRSAQQTGNSSDTSSLRTGAQESWATSLRDLVHKGGKKVAVHEYLSDVSGEDANYDEHKNQCGLLASMMKSRLSPSPELNLIQCSRHVQRVLRCVRDTWKDPEHRGEGCAGEGEDRSREHSFRERRDRVHGKEDRWFRSHQCQRSCVEKSEWALADEAIADSSTAEKKVCQQVEQRPGERKQPKVQN